MKKTITALVLIFALALSSLGSAGLVRDTSYGPVLGAQEGEALAWLSVPYGKAPVGELRWKAPQDPEPWSEVYDATYSRPMSLQLSGGVAAGSDDCLKLDIYAPADAEGLPVLVYIHGGNNQTGSSRQFSGAELAARNDIIFVSLSYRLGLLGFNCLPALLDEENPTGNFTVLDFAKALDWVKENIAAFGGDPGNVTVSGFSAGGRDVMALLISPLFEGKFQKAISFSGGMTTADEALSARKIAKALAPLAVADGVAETEEEAAQWLLQDTEEVRNYLYSLPAESLCVIGDAGIRMSVFPHLYTDGVALPEEGFETESYNSVPLIMLTGTTEFSFFALGDANYIDDEITLSAEDKGKALAFAIANGSKMYGFFNAESSAERMYSSYDAPIYLCTIEYGAPGSSHEIPLFGAFHGVFVPMLATEHGYMGITDWSEPGFEAMKATFNSYLKNFLYTGDPNGDGLPEWAEWEPETKLSIVMDGEEAVSATVATSYDEIMDAMDADTSLSEEAKQVAIRNALNGRWFSAALDERYQNKDLWQ